MMSVAVVGLSESNRQDIAARLRGVALDALPMDASATTCDAVGFLGAGAEDSRIERFLKDGRPVLLALERRIPPDRVQSLWQYAEQAKARLSIVNGERYRPSRQRIRQMVDAGKLGEPGLIRLHRWEAADGAAGTLPLDVDLVVWLFGKTPNLVYAVDNGNLLVHVGFPGGGMALIDHTQQLRAGDTHSGLSVIGSAGAAYSDGQQNRQLLFTDGSARAIAVGEGILPWVAMLQEFAIRCGQPDAKTSDGWARSDPCPAETWRDVLRVSQAVTQSLQTRRAVALGRSELA